MQNEKRLRITKETIVFMGVVAFFYDFLQAITTTAWIGLIISTIITIFSWLTFYVWFKIKGVSFFEGRVGKIVAKRLAPFIISFLIELFPAVNILPTITIGVVVTATFVYLEDVSVKKGVISEEDLKEFQKYLKEHKRILAGAVTTEDLRKLYDYGERRVGDKLQNSPRAQKISLIANTVAEDLIRERNRENLKEAA